MAETACPSTEPVKIGGATVNECGGEAAFWNTLSWVLLIIPLQDATQLSQFTLRHRTRLQSRLRIRTAESGLKKLPASPLFIQERSTPLLKML